MGKISDFYGPARRKWTLNAQKKETLQPDTITRRCRSETKAMCCLNPDFIRLLYLREDRTWELYKNGFDVMIRI